MPTITKEKTQELTNRFGKGAKDTGNVRVQVAILSERIANLTEHLKKNTNDTHSTRGLSMLVSQRRRLLDYYSRNDLEGYRSLVKDLGLRK